MTAADCNSVTLGLTGSTPVSPTKMENDMKIFELLIEAAQPNMARVLKSFVDVLNINQVKYVIGGANALAVYSARPRTTIDIDAFVDYNAKHSLDKQMLANGFSLKAHSNFHSKFEKDDVEIDLLYTGSPAEDWAVAHPVEKNILNVQVQTVNPESLLWLYINSDKPQNFVDAIELVKSQSDLDIDFVKKQISNDSDKLVHLENIIAKSKNINSRFNGSS